MKAELTVRTPSGNYPVTIGAGLEKTGFASYLSAGKAKSCFLIIDEHVHSLHGERIRQQIESTDMECHQAIVPSGEPSKSTGEWLRLIDFLLENRIRRNSPVIAAGGGVTGDLAGFAAATALRGVPLIHLPTTLLAMVDSSIGGKTGINHPTGKNLIGSFYQPGAVFMDTGFLETLPAREWSNGLSEILKYGAIENPDIFKLSDSLFTATGRADPGSAKSRDPESKDTNRSGPKAGSTGPVVANLGDLAKLIEICVKIKADFVEKDEKESGVRAFLNFGHTFAHALENAAGYGKISHGEAVFAGMIAAARLSQIRGADIDSIPFARFKPLYHYNREIFSIPTETLVQRMYSDKKIVTGTLRLVLLNKWGDPYLADFRETETVKEAWNYAFQELQSTTI